MSLKIQPDFRYAKTDEWVRVEGDEAVIGISDYAQDALSDIVYVELPSAGDTFESGKPFGVVESVKAASDVYAPVSGDILEANAAIVDDPAKVNADAEGAGWFVKLKLSNLGELSGLMDRAAYDKFCADQ